ncbi:adenosine deaminase [Vulcanimicrobium alpinum]|uniref:Adenosine deaminase n=1 Tax=Vulcanimicrobium alpinum TaxID=3016050 RepID=A0AAN2CAI5_UNVUL|nr:adenosine deaminase [Vulcanimicrobium alpinum]BDE06973.1 adenosine deaminase [Vulcanimicrobium alpinum]
MPVDLAALPKVQLHCHLEGTVRPATFRALARKYGVDLGDRADPERTYAFSTFREFLLLFAKVTETLRAPDDFAQIARDYVVDAAVQGVAYAEVFISPSVWTYFHRELDVRATVEAIRAALDEAGSPLGIEVTLIADLTRNFGVEWAERSAAEAVALADLGVVGVGLGGDEANYPPEWYGRAYAIAREGGLHGVAHAGEAAGPESVRAAVEILGAERIGHGVRAVEDPAVVELLAERGIPLEICPTSNRLTGAAPGGRPHPLGALDAAGCVVTIDADDPTMFGTTLLDEYAYVAGEFGEDALLRFAANAIDASFAPPAAKARLHAMQAASRNSAPAGRSR